MRRRLLATNALIALAAVLVLGIPLAVVEATRERADAEAQLEREADGVAALVDDRLGTGHPIDRGAVVQALKPGHAAMVRPVHGRPMRIGPPVGDDAISARS